MNSLRDKTSLPVKLYMHECLSEYPEALIRTVDVTDLQDWKPYTGNFKQNPVVELQDNGKDFVLKEKLDFWYYRYYSPLEDSDLKNQIFLERPSFISRYRLIYVHITIKPEFSTDFVSSPRFLWWLVSPLGRAAKPSVLHDLLYRVPLSIPFKECQDPVDMVQQEADYLFSLSLKMRKVGSIRKLMYLGLRLFGRYSFHKD